MTGVPSPSDTERESLTAPPPQGQFVRARDMRPMGRRIAGKRVERDLTQRELAVLAELSPHTITMVEQGKKPSISLTAVLSIAEALQVDLPYLVYGDERP